MEEKKKLCPILALRPAVQTKFSSKSSSDCVEDKCGWWDCEKSQCAVLSIVNLLGAKTIEKEE